MTVSLPTMAISALLGIAAANGQNIVLESQPANFFAFPITDIDGDGIPELYGEDSQGVPGLYDGSTLELKWILPQYPSIDDESYILSPYFDFNADGKKDVLLESLDENYNTTGFTIHDIVNNTSIFDFQDLEAGSWDEVGAWIYLADIDGDNEVEIVAFFFYIDNAPESFSIRTLIFSTGVALSAVSQSNARSGFRLGQNYPNPFNPSTNIAYSLPTAGHVNINVYNMKGRLVDNLVDRAQGAGYHKIAWNARQLSSGMYFYQITVDGKPMAARKAIFLK